jgi:hypothetical protein
MFNRIKLYVYRPVRKPDGRGGFTTTFDRIGTERGRVALRTFSARDSTRSEKVVGAQTLERLSHIAYLRRNADVRRGDRLRTAANDSVTGKPIWYDVFSRRLPGLNQRRAEFEVIETQKGLTS